MADVTKRSLFTALARPENRTGILILAGAALIFVGLVTVAFALILGTRINPPPGRFVRTEGAVIDTTNGAIYLRKDGRWQQYSNAILFPE